MRAVQQFDAPACEAGERAPAIDPGTCVSLPRPERHRSVHAAIIELSKPRITRLVTMTAGVGLALGVVARKVQFGASWSAGDLVVASIGCLVGTAASSAGANALNQWWESSRDARMKRTMHRPIPAGVIPPSIGLWAGLVMAAAGVGVLLWANGPAAALVSLATILIYVLIYTPSKVVTPWNTAVGAVPGALPPLIGWCAAATVGQTSGAWWSGAWGAGGWSLFALMFVWQIPHFLALAWMYRDDYAAGGYRMLPSVDPAGRITALTTLGGAIVLAPVTLLPVLAMPGVLGWAYGSVAAVTGVVFAVLAGRMVLAGDGGRVEQRAVARAVFLASIVHLPLLLVAMTAECLVRALT